MIILGSLIVFFYSTVSDMDKTSNLYVLFVDTKKAFDSIDHDYILMLLRKVGYPAWLVSIVRGLLAGARVMGQPGPGR